MLNEFFESDSRYGGSFHSSTALSIQNILTKQIILEKKYSIGWYYYTDKEKTRWIRIESTTQDFYRKPTE